MVLEFIRTPEPGTVQMVFRAEAEELAQAMEEEKTVSSISQDEADLLTAAVNRAILKGFSPLYAQAMEEKEWVPLTDPEFSLQAVNVAEGFRAEAEFFVLPPLEMGRFTGFEQKIEPYPIRPLTIELEVNQHHGDEDRAADLEGKKALRARVAGEIYQKRCAQARVLAEQKLIWQLGAEIKGELPKQLVAGNYFAEQRRFNLSLQARGVNFDQYLKVQGQTVEEFRQELHAEAEQKLRSRLGLLMVAGREKLWPTEAEVEAAMAQWDNKRDGEPTFESNDRRKVRQRIASGRAAGFVIAHSTLLPPPEEPVIAELKQS